MTNTPPIANNWGYGAFTFGYDGTVTVAQGTSPTGFVDNPALYLSQPFPGLATPLPNKDPSSANFNQVATTAPDANRPGYVQNWDLTVQYELPKETLLEVAYIGNKGTRLWGGTPGSGFSEYDALPSSLLSMGDILNQNVLRISPGPCKVICIQREKSGTCAQNAIDGCCQPLQKNAGLRIDVCFGSVAVIN